MNTITIFNGKHTPTLVNVLEYKGDYEISGDFTLSRDLLNLKTSVVTIIDTTNNIIPQDIIVFQYENKTRFGKIYEVDREFDRSTLSFTYGMDSHQEEIPFMQSWQNFSGRPYFDNRQDLQIEIKKYATGSLSLIAPDGVLGIDVALRQFARRSFLAEQYSFIKSTADTRPLFMVRLTDENVGGYNTGTSWDTPLENLTIRLDDPYIKSSYILKIGSDSMTRLRLYQEGNLADYEDYQRLNNGNVVIDSSFVGPIATWWEDYAAITPTHPDSILPQKFSVKVAPTADYQSLDYATDIFYQNEYDNEIEIELPEHNPYFSLTPDRGKFGVYDRPYITIDTLLGRPTRVYLPNSDVYIDTIVSGYEISKGVMKIVFGLSRTRLTDVINTFINKDNV